MIIGASASTSPQSALVPFLLDCPQQGVPMLPLTDEEKRAIVYRFTDLQSAIEREATDMAAKYRAFQSAYHGDSRAFVESFERLHTAVEQRRWVRQLRIYLDEEIEPTFWSPRIDH